MKYVIVEREVKKGKPRPSLMPKYPIIFSDHLVHSDMVPAGYVAVSAGDVMIEARSRDMQGATCSGKSESLGLRAHPTADSYLILVWLQTGESMLIMASETYEDMAEEDAKDTK